jgi:hypothetical protein
MLSGKITINGSVSVSHKDSRNTKKFFIDSSWAFVAWWEKYFQNEIILNKSLSF